MFREIFDKSDIDRENLDKPDIDKDFDILVIDR